MSKKVRENTCKNKRESNYENEEFNTDNESFIWL